MRWPRRSRCWSRGTSSIQFRLNQIDGCLRLDVWSGDTGLVPRAELESLLLAAERLLVAAAHGDLAHDQMPAFIGLEPMVGTPDRILADHCWIDIADVQRLVDEAVAPAVDEAVAPAVAHVFAPAGDQPLTAFLTATDAVHTPQQAHARCMTALAHHRTAITPHHYVFCDQTPGNPAHLESWRRLPIRVEGSGRA